MKKIKKNYLILGIFIVIGFTFGLVMNFGLLSNVLPTYADSQGTGDANVSTGTQSLTQTGVELTGTIQTGSIVSTGEVVTGSVVTGEVVTTGFVAPPSSTPTPASSTGDVQSGYVFTQKDNDYIDRLNKKLDAILAKSEDRAKLLLVKIQKLQKKVKINGRTYKLLLAMETHLQNAFNVDVDENQLESMVFSGDDVKENLKTMCDAKASQIKNFGKIYFAFADGYTGANFSDSNVSQYGGNLYLMKNLTYELTGINTLLDPHPIIGFEKYVSCRMGSKEGENANYLYCEAGLDVNIPKKLNSDGTIVYAEKSKTFFGDLVLSSPSQGVESPKFKDYYAKFNSFKVAYEKGLATYSGWNYQKQSSDEGYKSFQKRYYNDENKEFYTIYSNAKRQVSSSTGSIDQYAVSEISKKYKRYFFTANIIDLKCTEVSSFNSQLKLPDYN